jgi:hypothetical protein
MFNVAMDVELYLTACVHKERSWHLVTAVISFRLNRSFGMFSEDEAMFIIK